MPWVVSAAKKCSVGPTSSGTYDQSINVTSLSIIQAHEINLTQKL